MSSRAYIRTGLILLLLVAFGGKWLVDAVGDPGFVVSLVVVYIGVMATVTGALRLGKD